MRIRTKICGITNIQDALHAVASGADALGFVFYEHSPRYIAPEAAAQIVAVLPPFVERVGLFVHASARSVNHICQQAHMSLAQIHFEVDAAYWDALNVKELPVVRAKQPEDLDRYADRYRLVDAYVASYGGSGKRLALEWFAGRDNRRIILAGGLTPDTVAETVPFGFYGVDVSSGVEISPGKKDPRKIEQFIAHATSL